MAQLITAIAPVVTFSCFQDLPKEIRLQIWRATLPWGPRIIPFDNEFDTKTSPGLDSLFANLEACKETLRFFKAVYDPKLFGPPLIFDPVADTLLLSFDSQSRLEFRHQTPNNYVFHLAVEDWGDGRHFYATPHGLEDAFSNLKSVTFIQHGMTGDSYVDPNRLQQIFCCSCDVELSDKEESMRKHLLTSRKVCDNVRRVKVAEMMDTAVAEESSGLMCPLMTESVYEGRKLELKDPEWEWMTARARGLDLRRVASERFFDLGVRHRSIGGGVP